METPSETHTTSKKRTGIEEEMYRSCLRQVVAHLNTTLPPLSDTEESSEVPVKQQPPKKKLTREEPTKGSYMLRDVKPSKVREACVKKEKKKVFKRKGVAKKREVAKR